VVATRPLTRDEIWIDVKPGNLLVLRDGHVRT
jgi:predicted glutamine amidotransferase